jgi:hypothetical protein
LVGFEWLTHSADYANFPASLVVTCVFDNNQALQEAIAKNQDKDIRKSVQRRLLKVGILLKDVRRNVCFETEQACIAEHHGDLKNRLG